MSAAEDLDLSEDERRGFDLIREQGAIHQSEFWKELDVSSRKGSRIASALESAGLIERSETVYQGHNTYLLEPVVDENDLDFSLLMAGDMLSPFVGEEDIDPQSDAFSQWVMSLAYEGESGR
ncbi:MAG: helix-turn-helix transcriptional regulator [Halanaeroarchaeum sp.]